MSGPEIKLISLNIERSEHLEKVIPFLVAESPDVCCLQEVSESDVSRFEQELQSEGMFVPMTHHPKNDNKCIGVGIFSRLPIRKKRIKYFSGDDDIIPQFIKGDPSTYDRMLLICEVEKNGSIFNIGNTHFTWSPNGETSDIQRKDLERLLKILEKEKELVFTGDFNAPRGREIFSKLSESFADNVPLEYTTSIDGTLHRAGPMPYMVDGFFSSAKYRVEKVKMVCGVSDHCALVGTVGISKSDV